LKPALSFVKGSKGVRVVLTSKDPGKAASPSATLRTGFDMLLYCVSQLLRMLG
jgi:hypothetical protein